MRRKQNLASALGIQKENWGNHAFFRDNKASKWEKTRYIALYFTVFFFFKLLLEIIISEKYVVTP